MSTENDLVLSWSADRRIAQLVINRPEHRNALNRATQQELRHALDQCASARVIIITGAGDRAFCSGIDLSELHEEQARTAKEHDPWLEVCNEVRHHAAIVVAAVNGYALGGGLTLVNASDLALAADTASFAIPEVGFGSFPRLSGTSTIRRCLPKRAAWLALTGDRIDAGTAERWGLVNQVVPAEELAMRARQLAERLAALDPVALSWTKRGLHEVEHSDWEHALSFGSYVRAMVLRDRVEQ